VRASQTLVATNIPLKQFIRAAYTMQLYQIVDVPSWADTERSDVHATSERNLSDGRPWTPGAHYRAVQSMMQALLAARFRRLAQLETREAQGFALGLNKAGDRSKLAPAKTPCEAQCGMRAAPDRLAARNVPLPTLAEFLSQVTRRRVVDASGVTGTVDIDLRWAVEGRPAPD
jgi:uncharacterized protein (TIGR03435 family)